jgi:hypothetical protein
MTLTHSISTPDTTPEHFRWTRLDAADARQAFHDSFPSHGSQRQFAQQHGIPRATLQQWLDDQPFRHLDSTFVAFFRSPAGEHFLRRLLLALHLLFNQAGTAGLRTLGRFLRLTRLDAFVAPSYGAQQAMAARLQHDLGTFADEQADALGKAMANTATAPKPITLCTDENFHGQKICLVAIEPVSNFIVLEAYHPHRDAQTWTTALNAAVAGLPVTVLQITSDQAKGLLACAAGLGAHHSPDLFHDQQELTQATGLALHRHLEAAEKDLDQAGEWLASKQRDQEQYQVQPRPGRPPDFGLWIGLAQQRQEQAAAAVEACQQRRQRVSDAVRGLADDYHPFDPATGQPREAKEVGRCLEQRLNTIAEVVEEAKLGERPREAVARVRRWLVPLVATIGWFWSRVRTALDNLELSEEAEAVVRNQLLPGLYWSEASGRGRDPEQRRALATLSERLLKEAWRPSSPLSSLAEAERERVREVVLGAARLFVRSSSCVEGRNGRLSLQHHGQGGLGGGRLKALTALHNYVPDGEGETAAGRFFGVSPPDMFEWLLARLPDLPRPGKRPKNQLQEVADN